MLRLRQIVPVSAALAATLVLSGCLSWLGLGGGTSVRHGERECLMRAMYFESIRSSDEGMLAVGTVVMNRVADPRYPNGVCAVVGQPNQFAPGVLTRSMTEQHSTARAGRAADRILSGYRHPGVHRAMHFHQAGLRFPYRNMHYVLEAGGNEFYERR